MFRVDRTLNRISRLAKGSFGELAFREREHLQEWLVHEPSALGEELLIIQKEFDGFDETRERLDLLALDKDGNLVIIENKLDDSGRDVTWQALKYTAYVSGFTKAQIVQIYQKYLDRHVGQGTAAESICEFLGVEDLDEAELNRGNDQRMIFLAANFRREVTATVLWLISRGIRAQCFRVTPFAYGHEIFVDLQQIIPPPEVADYMIGLSTKEAEESSAHGKQRHRHDLRTRFWVEALASVRAAGLSRFSNLSPSRSHWLSATSGVRGCPIQLIFGQHDSRVQLSVGTKDVARNKLVFDRLLEHQTEIDAAMGLSLIWRRMDENKQSLIICQRDFEGHDAQEWPKIISWMVETIPKFEAAVIERLVRAVDGLPVV